MCEKDDIRISMYLEEYRIRNQESVRASEGFNAQSKFAQMYITALFVIIAFLLNWISQDENISRMQEYITGIIIIFLALPAIFTYLHSIVLVSARDCYLARYRMAVIERKLKEITGVDAPIWESEIILNFQSSHFITKDGYFNPAWWLGLWAFISGALVQTLLVILCFSIFNNTAMNHTIFPCVYTAYVSILLFMDSFLHYYILSRGERAIEKRMEKISNMN